MSLQDSALLTVYSKLVEAEEDASFSFCLASEGAGLDFVSSEIPECSMSSGLSV